jgi:hypothetical protein
MHMGNRGLWEASHDSFWRDTGMQDSWCPFPLDGDCAVKFPLDLEHQSLGTRQSFQ